MLVCLLEKDVTQLNFINYEMKFVISHIRHHLPCRIEPEATGH